MYIRELVRFRFEKSGYCNTRRNIRYILNAHSFVCMCTRMDSGLSPSSPSSPMFLCVRMFAYWQATRCIIYKKNALTTHTNNVHNEKWNRFEWAPTSLFLVVFHIIIYYYFIYRVCRILLLLFTCYTLHIQIILINMRARMHLSTRIVHVEWMRKFVWRL